jgi:hypothetical protein
MGLTLMVIAKLTSFALAFALMKTSAADGVPVHLVIERAIFCAGLLVVVVSFAVIAFGAPIKVDTKQ